MDLQDFQQLIEKMYSHKDRARGPAGTFMWLMEEIGEQLPHLDVRALSHGARP